MMIKKSIILFLLILFSVSGFAQNSRNISGKVLSEEDGEPLPGATIVIKGTRQGAVTDYNGKFVYLLKGDDIKNMQLMVSYIGFKSKTIKVGDKTEFKIFLEPEVSSLKEVVITSSYGTEKLKQEVVGSITSVKPQDIIIEQSVSSFDELLEGQTSGVLIEASEGVGEPVNIHIRGQGSLTPTTGKNVGTSTQPLIIVDGIILSEEISLESNSLFDGSDTKFSENMMNPLAKIGITDIASINVLKDAAAVSLYGADGANGVIIITTKGGEKGPMKVNFSAQGGVSAAMNPIEYMNGEQYNELKNLYYLNSGFPENVQPWNGVNTDWFGLMNRTGVFQRYTLSLSGGAKMLNYRVGGNYQHVEEPQVNNNFTSYNTSLSASLNLGKFKATLKTSPSFSVKNSPNALYNYAVPPDISPYTEDGEFTPFHSYGNPIAVANQNIVESKTASLLNSISAVYDINENLQFSTLFGLDFSNKDQTTFYSGLNQTGIDGKGDRGDLMFRDRDTRKWNWNAKLFYKKQFNKSHYIDVLAGVETRSNTVEFARERGKGFEVFDKPQPIKQGASYSFNSDKSESTGRSFLSQANYDYKKKYFLLANFRADQSSVFGNDNNTSYNTGIGLSWVISKESFMGHPYWLDFLRLRTSYGTSGNSRIGSYSSLGLYTVDDDEGYDGYNQGHYAHPSTTPNPNLGWEKNYKFNIGLDITTTYRFSATIEFFNDNISDMIVSRSVIPEMGYDNVQINGAEMYNRGIEFSTTIHWLAFENFKWYTNFNVSKIKNEVTYLKGLGSEYSSAERGRAEKVGYSTSTMWGYHFMGIDPATGRELYKINNQVVDGATLYNYFRSKDNWTPIGNSQPDFFGGFSNKFTIYKNITLAITASFSVGGDKLIQKELLDQYRIIVSRNLAVNAYYDSWKAPGDISLYPSVSNSNPLFSNTTKYLYDNSHLKLNSVNLSYNLPLKDKTKGIKKLRVFLNGSNLFYYYFNQSPENRNGIKELKKVYPDMRTVSFGINANF